MRHFTRVRGVRFGLSVSNRAMRHNRAMSVLFNISRLIDCIDRFFVLGANSLLFANAPMNMNPLRVNRRMRNFLRNRHMLTFGIQ